MVEPVWEVVALAGWGVLLVNLLLTLRIVRWLRSMQEEQKLGDARVELPDLPLGQPAPAFRATDLSGRTVRSQEYSGREIALLFVSPHCGLCRQQMSHLVAVAADARQRAGAEMLLVSDVSAREITAWMAQIKAVDKVEVTIPVLLASRSTSELYEQYNPRALTPYFCHIDKAGNVAARGGLHTAAWAALSRRWSPAVSRGQHRYR